MTGYERLPFVKKQLGDIVTEYEKLADDIFTHGALIGGTSLAILWGVIEQSEVTKGKVPRRTILNIGLNYLAWGTLGTICSGKLSFYLGKDIARDVLQHKYPDKYYLISEYHALTTPPQ